MHENGNISIACSRDEVAEPATALSKLTTNVRHLLPAESRSAGLIQCTSGRGGGGGARGRAAGRGGGGGGGRARGGGRPGPGGARRRRGRRRRGRRAGRSRQ